MELQQLQLLHSVKFKIRLWLVKGGGLSLSEERVRKCILPTLGEIEQMERMSEGELIIEVRKDDKKYEQLKQKQNVQMDGGEMGGYFMQILGEGEINNKFGDWSCKKQYYIMGIVSIFLVFVAICTYILIHIWQNQQVSLEIQNYNIQQSTTPINQPQWVNQDIANQIQQRRNQQILNNIIPNNPQIIKARQKLSIPSTIKNTQQLAQKVVPKTTSWNPTAQDKLIYLGGPSIKTHFKINDNKHIAQLWTLQPIYFQSWLDQYQYLMPTQTQVLRFPSDRWQHKNIYQIQYQMSDNQFYEWLEDVKNEKNPLVEYEQSFEYKIAKNFLMHPTHPTYIEGEYRYLSQKYNLDAIEQQIKLCVVVTAYNIVESNKFVNFFKTINAQNYTNYEIFYIDDGSTDDTYHIMYAYVDDNYPQLRSKITFFKRKQRVGDLANKDHIINDFCSKDSLVVDMRAQEYLVGHQVFKVINSVYRTNSNIWVTYSKGFNVVQKNSNNMYMPINQKKISIDVTQYRDLKITFTANQLKVYQAFLFHKIPLQHLTHAVETEDGDQILAYFQRADQMAIMYSVMEMAGNDRVSFIPEYLSVIKLQALSECEQALQIYDSIEIQTLNRLHRLQYLNDEPMTELKHQQSDEYIISAHQQYMVKCQKQTQ